MPIKQREVESALQRKGFVEADSHHRQFIYYTREGKKSAIRSKTSHGHAEIPDNLVGVMARQVKLTTSQFKKLVDCAIEQEEYEQLVKDHL